MRRWLELSLQERLNYCIDHQIKNPHDAERQYEESCLRCTMLEFAIDILEDEITQIHRAILFHSERNDKDTCGIITGMEYIETGLKQRVVELKNEKEKKSTIKNN